MSERKTILMILSWSLILLFGIVDISNKLADNPFYDTGEEIELREELKEGKSHKNFFSTPLQSFFDHRTPDFRLMLKMSIGTAHAYIQARVQFNLDKTPLYQQYCCPKIPHSYSS